MLLVYFLGKLIFILKMIDFWTYFTFKNTLNYLEILMILVFDYWFLWRC